MVKLDFHFIGDADEFYDPLNRAAPFLLPSGFAQSLNPWPGRLNFQISIPDPVLDGVKPKWFYSSILKKFYVAKKTAFPLDVKMDMYPPGATLIFCPVFNKDEHRMNPVYRCHNCGTADPPNLKDYILWAENDNATYFEAHHRLMLSVPLGSPAPGDNLCRFFLKLVCNTSCVGGPNRRQFSLLIILQVGGQEIGRQVLSIKCCEGPSRDMRKEENCEKKIQKLADMHGINLEGASVISKSSNSTTKALAVGKKRLSMQVALPNHSRATHGLDNEVEQIHVPKKYVRKVKKYINELVFKDYFKSLKKKDFNSLKYFTSATDSD